MPILDVARCIQELGKYAVNLPPSYYDFFYTIPTGYPFLYGVYPTFQSAIIQNEIAPIYGWDFTSAPDKPQLGDTFGIRFSRFCTYNPGSTVANVAGQWLWQFKDALGNTIGGLRHGPAAINGLPASRSYELVAGTSVISIGGDILYPQTHNDWGITCYVDANEIRVSLYCNQQAAMYAGNTLSLIGTVTNSNTALGYGPVSALGVEPNHAVNSSSNGLNARNGSDQAAYVACSFSVNEDVANLFITNAYALTTTGATLTSLAITSTPEVVSNNGRANFTGFFNAARDQRRTFKLANVSGKPLPAYSYSLVQLDFALSFGLSAAARQILATDSDLEFFTRFDGVNYSVGRFGSNVGATEYRLVNNPATLLPFESFAQVEVGIVLREKI